MTEAGLASGAPDRLDYLGRVLDQDGNPSGTCFQVESGVMVTAWHVLDDIGASEVASTTQLDPLVGGDRFEAQVIALDPVHDLAVLAAAKALPKTASTLVDTGTVALRTLVTVTGHATIDDPAYQLRYLTAPGEWSGTAVRSDGVTVGRIISDGVVPGMAGAPVVRDSDGAVIGMVSARYNSADGWLNNTVWITRSEDITSLLTGNVIDTEPISEAAATKPDEGPIPVLGGPIAVDTGAPVAALAVGEAAGRRVVVSGGENAVLRVWDVATGEHFGEPLVGHTGAVWAVALGERDGNPIVVSGGQDTTVRLWNLGTAQVMGPPLEAHTGPVNSVALGLLNGQSIAVSASDDRTLRIWGVADGRLISTLTGHTDWVNSVATGLLDGRLVAVSGSADRTVRVWDLAESRLTATLTGHAESVSSVAVGVVDGRLVAVSGSTDQTVRVWDLASGRLVSTMIGHLGRVRAVAVSVSNVPPIVLSGGDDGTVRAWDLTDGTQFGETMVEHFGPVRALGIIALDGTPTVISGGGDGFIRTWVPRIAIATRQRDQVEWLPDSPADSDLLHRRPLAQALSTRLRRFHEEDPGTSFLVHIDGAWGTGKSTLINLLRSELGAEWLTVDIDAWRQSRLGPPWWALLTAVRRDVGRHLTWPHRIWLRLAESGARARRGGSPFALAIILLLAIVAAIFVLLKPDHLTFSSAGDLAEVVTAAIAAFGILWAGALVAGRFLLWDSVSGARLFEQSNTNPMQGVADHFAWLIARAKQPVVFFVDDLDRCAEAYVVDFLEAVQTLIREPTKDRQAKSQDGAMAASIVIAADGAWIRRSYEIAYSAFESSVSEPGRPLGYLFLDKLFQLRVPVPSIDARRQHEYLSELLRVRGPDEVTQIIAVEEQSVRDRLRRSSTENEVVEALRSASPVVRARVAEAAVQKLSAPEVEAATEHALLRFAPLLMANPRSIKRFVNDYSILRAVRTLEGNPVQSEPLALWAILETQWPVLADYLRAVPEAVQQIVDSAAELDRVPANIRLLFHDPSVRRLATFEYGGPLTPDLIRSCCGAPSAS